MHIAMIGQKGIPAKFGGVERHVHALALRLAASGDTVTVYARSWYTEGSEVLTVPNLSVIETPTIHTKHLDAIVHTLTSTIHAMIHGHDVYHFHGVGPSLLSFLPRLFRPNARVITTFHSIDRHRPKWGRVAKWILHMAEYTSCVFAHETIVVSQGLQRYCKDKFQKETVYIPNGVALSTEQADRTLLAPFHLSENNYILLVSRLTEEKGAHILIRAFTQLKQQYPNDPAIQDLKLAIVGGSSFTDAYVADLHRMSGAHSDVVFTDFQAGATLHTLYRHARMMVHPSFLEGLPISVLEGMSYEQYIIVSDIAEHRELISKPECLFEAGNAEDLAKKLYTALTSPKGVLQPTINAHKYLVDTMYTWESVVERIKQVYQKDHCARRGEPVALRKPL